MRRRFAPTDASLLADGPPTDMSRRRMAFSTLPACTFFRSAASWPGSDFLPLPDSNPLGKVFEGPSDAISSGAFRFRPPRFFPSPTGEVRGIPFRVDAGLPLEVPPLLTRPLMGPGSTVGGFWNGNRTLAK